MKCIRFLSKRSTVGCSLLMAFLALTGPSLAQLPENTAIAFEQIDDLSPYEDWLLPFVCIHDMKLLDLISGDKNISAYGFFKSESDKTFEVICLDLRIRTFDKRRQNFASIDLAEYSKELLSNKRQLFFRGDRSTMERWVELLVLARAAYQRGDFDSCGQFLAAAAAQNPRVKSAAAADNMRVNFGVDFRAAFARSEFREILLLLGDLKVARPQILARVKKFFKAFPESQYSQQAGVLEDELIEMVAQDAMHETPENISSLTMDQQINEWLFQLRNQNAIQVGPEGKWDIFWKDSVPTYNALVRDDNSESPPSPAMQLVKIGNYAVPKLIEHIGDCKPTRSTPFQRDVYVSERILTVGQCAEIILSKIAGQPFGDGQSRELARRQAKAWWEEVVAKGERKYLIERVASGGKESVDSSSTLAAKFPDAAFDCIAKAIDESKDSRIQSTLLEVIGQLPCTEKVTAYLMHQLKNASELDTRLVAARLILPRDRDAAINAMILEFHQMLTYDAGGHWESEELALITFLSRSDSLPAIQKLREAYDSRKPEIRTSIILSFLNKSWAAGTDSKLSGLIEELLVHALSDTAQRLGFTLQRDEGVFKSPRNCELAGYVLGSMLPSEYKFEFPLTKEKLDEQRLFAIKYLRGKNQLTD